MKVCVPPAKSPPSDLNLVLGDDRECNDACCEVDGAGEGGGRDKQIPGWIRPSTVDRTPAGRVVTRRSTTFSAVVLRVANRSPRPLEAPPFLFLGRASQPHRGGPHGRRRYTQVFYIRSHNVVPNLKTQEKENPSHLPSSPSDDHRQTAVEISCAIVRSPWFRRRRLRDNGQTRLL